MFMAPVVCTPNAMQRQQSLAVVRRFIPGIYTARCETPTQMSRRLNSRDQKNQIFHDFFFLSFSLVSYLMSKKVCHPLDKHQIYRVDVELEAHDGKMVNIFFRLELLICPFLIKIHHVNTIFGKNVKKFLWFLKQTFTGTFLWFLC